MNDAQQKKAAREFSLYWKDKGYEKGESQAFWMSLLRDVYGVEHPEQFISFEDQVKLDHTSFIDGYIPSTYVMIEQKGLGKDLRKGIKQSDGSVLSPFQQAKRYASELPYSKRPRWIITCNFAEFLIYDMEKPNAEPEQLLLQELPKEYYRLQFLVDTKSTDFQKEMQLSVDAGKITEKLYQALLAQYQNPDSPDTLKSLNMLCVRLVFCFYADNSGVFNRNQFRNHFRDLPVSRWHRDLKDLFRVLDTDKEHRDPYEDELNAFPYVNGGLFADENIEIPRFTQEIADIVLNEACVFDWKDISPTIFGAVFESTLNPETRRSGGMHYTSLENIHKVIDPLFLDDLKAELETIKALKQDKTRNSRLEEYRQKLATLTFFDPACGSGNFLTQTYIELRRLENQALFAENNGQLLIGNTGDANPINVSISQFYGIEINDFAVTVAKTALWIAESQMMQETEQLMQINLEFLPLKSYANIVEGNALRLDWRSVAPDVSYIMGNPPFIGYSLQSKDQKDDILSVYVDKFGKPYKTAGKIDYVAGWYFKAAQYMECPLESRTAVQTAFVSTNSITQGEQVAGVWKSLYERFQVHIDFAYRSFIWDSEASQKAHVHCVIIGFSTMHKQNEKRLYNSDRFQIVQNISPYLIDAPNIFIESRKTPVSDVPDMVYGNKPTDGGFLFLTADERTETLIKEPNIAKFIKKIYGASEYINNKERYCLWLVGASPSEIRKSPFISERVAKVKEFRSNSTKEATKRSADTPSLFQEIRQPSTNYVLVPRHSSENRRYIPLGFVSPEIIVNDAVQIIPNADLYLFGILTSNVHMAWVKAVCGRLEMRFRYSKDIVYNNFPFPAPSDEQRQCIEHTAQAILKARTAYPDSSLADLYDELTMPPDLRKAHQQNDFAVMSAYGFPKTITESECVAELMKMYQRLTAS